jgi:hypothetical protein
MSNDPLAQLNDHFARFLQHADGLLREWRSAIDEQTKQVQSRVAREVDGHLDQAVGDSLARLRDQIDQLTRASGGARVRGARSPGGPAGAVDPPDGPRRSWLLAALVSANVMLALVLGLSIKSCADSGRDTGALAGTTAPIATGPDAGQVVAPVAATPDAGFRRRRPERDRRDVRDPRDRANRRSRARVRRGRGGRVWRRRGQGRGRRGRRAGRRRRRQGQVDEAEVQVQAEAQVEVQEEAR